MLLRKNRLIQKEQALSESCEKLLLVHIIVLIGINSVKLEILLVAVGHNLYKYQNKKMRNTTAAYKIQKENLYGVGGVCLFSVGF